MTGAIIAGLLLGLALVFSVGPVIFTILKLRINYSLASAFYFITGVWLSDLIWVVTANLFGTFLTGLQQYTVQIGTGGGIFLMSLGIYYLFFKKYHSKAELDEGVKIGNSTHARLLITGFLINTLNPGVIALWLAAATKALDSTMNEKIVTFSICLAMNIGADFLKINLAGKVRNKLNDKTIVIVNRISGSLFLVFGVLVLAAAWYAKYHPKVTQPTNNNAPSPKTEKRTAYRKESIPVDVHCAVCLYHPAAMDRSADHYDAVRERA